MSELLEHFAVWKAEPAARDDFEEPPDLSRLFLSHSTDPCHPPLIPNGTEAAYPDSDRKATMREFETDEIHTA